MVLAQTSQAYKVHGDAMKLWYPSFIGVETLPRVVLLVQPVEDRGSSDPSNRAAQVGKRRSSALGYPTDDEGLVALPAFTLNDSK